MSDTAPAQNPQWLDDWKASPEAQLPRRPGNPSWQRGMRSPNPAGRPRGQTKQTKLMQRMLDDAGDVLDAVLSKAKEGDSGAASLVLSRILPTLRSQAEKVTFEFDPSAPVGVQVEQVLAALASGAVAADTARLIIDAIHSLAAIRAVEDLEQRIAQLEEKQT